MANSFTATAATAANTVNSINSFNNKLDRISINPGDAIQQLGELHRIYGNYPAMQVPIMTLLFERKLCEQLVEADRAGKLDLGLGTDRPDEEAGDLESMAGRLLKHYCTMRGLYEGPDVSEFIDEGEDLADFLDDAEDENENVFYAAQYLLVYSALGDGLDKIAREGGYNSWDAMTAEN